MHLKINKRSLSNTAAARRICEAAPVPESFILLTGAIEGMILAALTDDPPVFMSWPEGVDKANGART